LQNVEPAEGLGQALRLALVGLLHLVTARRNIAAETVEFLEVAYRMMVDQ
jgi:hypothetical protein